MLRQLKQKGQSSLEYAVLLMILMGAMILGGTYFKRGVQGSWKSAADNLGEQYDPRTAVGTVRTTYISDTQTIIEAVPTANGYETRRTDFSNTQEIKNGFMFAGPYP